MGSCRQVPNVGELCRKRDMSLSKQMLYYIFIIVYKLMDLPLPIRHSKQYATMIYDVMSECLSGGNASISSYY